MVGIGGLVLLTISLWFGELVWLYSQSLYGLGRIAGSTHHLFMVWVVGLVLLTISLWFG
jgi:hypothetical protein